MKHKVLTALAAGAVLFAVPTFAEEQEESPLELYLQTDFSYSPLCDPVTGSTHYAPITGPYLGVLFRSTIHADYTIKTPLGENFLLKDANLKLKSSFELSPVSIKPAAGLTFTPLPFLEFSSNIEAGTGWSVIGINGMEEYKSSSREYEALTPFCNWYVKASAGATFQFDTGAIFEGDWTHVITLASYTVAYTMLTDVHDKSPWSWQRTYHYSNALNYNWYFVLGYRLPFKLNLVAASLELYGNYNSGTLSDDFKAFDDSFMYAKLGPLASIDFDEKNSLMCMLIFMTRRSFTEGHEIDEMSRELSLTKSGTEWFFDSIAFRWTHRF